MVILKSLTEHSFAGRMVGPGEVFEATEHEARILVAIQRAVIAELEDKPVRTKRAYRRRDMTAAQYDTKAV
jgi:hypothetical protein